MYLSKNGDMSVNIKNAIDIEKFLTLGEYDQGDCGLISYDDLYDYIEEIKKSK